MVLDFQKKAELFKILCFTIYPCYKLFNPIQNEGKQINKKSYHN